MMETSPVHIHFPANALLRRRSPASSGLFVKRKLRLRAERIGDENDPFLQSAIDSASLRVQETHRAEPLFIDPYADCFLQPNERRKNVNERERHYCLATKFIDDKLLDIANGIDGLKQVVLLTDGMDTRPYRLNWPTSTMIFDISPERVFKFSSEKLQGVGARIPRGCLFSHVSMESTNIEQSLCSKGFSGNRPSIWAIQGLPLLTLSSFEDILSVVSSMAMNECCFFGELPCWLAQTENMPDATKWMDKLFMSNGFRVDRASYEDIATSLGREMPTGKYENILFVAQQLRFSDDQMETWRREFQRIEEDGDEEGFEEL
ncbi:PREDICTED: uncharacterized protein LOC104825968 isoform X2 [Tarenaya hassleriana]|uniref:uncharacterized protein LOC104825968 isoform X2 n=1 Tax=Tarenaya hassleriana TaxID=28532 RepID=UPI00053C256E|nr:PREDICTED: uncharacterized protein LOC104825968 isoform X2 [Tarenaya hassleriana]